MSTSDGWNFEVLAVAGALALCHLLSPQAFRLQERLGIPAKSLSGGLAVAYVCLHLLPSLEQSHEAIGRRVYGITLLGFALLYGVESAVHRNTLVPQFAHYVIRLSIAFVYNGLIVFTLVLQLPGTVPLTILFTLSLALHLVSMDVGLQEAGRLPFARRGRLLLAASVLAGYLLSLMRRPHEAVVDSLTALLAGFMLFAVFLEELPQTAHARYLWFLAGAAGFSSLHVLVG